MALTESHKVELIRSNHTYYMERLVRSSHRNVQGCIIPTGKTKIDGQLEITKRFGAGVKLTMTAPKLMWILFNGRMPDEDKRVTHLCGVMACCNPAHLKEDTHYKKNQRSAARKRNNDS